MARKTHGGMRRTQTGTAVSIRSREPGRDCATGSGATFIALRLHARRHPRPCSLAFRIRNVWSEHRWSALISAEPVVPGGVAACRQIEPHDEKILPSEKSKIETIGVKTPINSDLW